MVTLSTYHVRQKRLLRALLSILEIFIANKSLYLAMLAAAVCTGFTSCSNNDDDGQPTNTQLWVGELGAPAYEADAVAY